MTTRMGLFCSSFAPLRLCVSNPFTVQEHTRAVIASAAKQSPALVKGSLRSDSMSFTYREIASSSYRPPRKDYLSLFAFPGLLRLRPFLEIEVI